MYMCTCTRLGLQCYFIFYYHLLVSVMIRISACTCTCISNLLSSFLFVSDYSHLYQCPCFSVLFFFVSPGPSSTIKYIANIIEQPIRCTPPRTIPTFSNYLISDSKTPPTTSTTPFKLYRDDFRHDACRRNAFMQ